MGGVYLFFHTLRARPERFGQFFSLQFWGIENGGQNGHGVQVKGRKPKPTALKQLNGSAKVNPGRLNPNEPAGSVTTYQKPPHYLNAYAKREWDRLLPLLIEGQILRAEDLAAFEAHCIAYGDLVAITKAMGSKYLDDEGRLNPLVAKKQAAITALLKTAAPLGLTPSDRTRVATLEAQDKPDGIEQFFSGPEQLRRVK